MIDSLTLYGTMFHKVKLIDNDNKEHIGTVDLYESEYDSGYGVASISLSTGVEYTENDIKSIEILD